MQQTNEQTNTCEFTTTFVKSIHAFTHRQTNTVILTNLLIVRNFCKFCNEQRITLTNDVDATYIHTLDEYTCLFFDYDMCSHTMKYLFFIIIYIYVCIIKRGERRVRLVPKKKKTPCVYS